MEQMNKLVLKYGEELFKIEVIKTRRRTVALQIYSLEKIVLRAPLVMSDEVLLEALKVKASWLSRKIAAFKEREQRLAKEKTIKQNLLSQNKELAQYGGRNLLYQGEYYKLVLEEVNLKLAESINIAGQVIVVKISSSSFKRLKRIEQEEEYLQKRLSLWYREQALAEIRKLVDKYQSFFVEKVSLLQVKTQKSRWGSCSNDNALRFNWRLIMAHPKALEYVVVHEMSHLPLANKNHGSSFWRTVEYLYPDYKVWRDWLKEHEKLLLTEEIF